MHITTEKESTQWKCSRRINKLIESYNESKGKYENLVKGGMGRTLSQI